MRPLDIYCARCVGAKTRIRITISTDSPDHIGVKLGCYENQTRQHKHQYAEIETQTEHGLTSLNHQRSKGVDLIAERVQFGKSP